MYFEWKDEYRTGIEVIDKQHKHLMEIGARIFDLANADDGYDRYDDIMEVLNELRDYTIYHFGYEEKLMESITTSAMNRTVPALLPDQKDRKFEKEKMI